MNATNLNYPVDNVRWAIDRIPDHNLINLREYNLINNIQINYPTYNEYFRNRYFEEQFTELTQQLISGTIQFNIQDEIDDDVIPFDNHDDFIPFEKPIVHIVKDFDVSQEEKLCCICYETKESDDISKINCKHKFCSHCIIQHISNNHNNSFCPLCREKITHITFQDQSYQDDFVKIIQNS